MTQEDSRQRADGRTGARLPGPVIAGATALISGVSIFVNSYGVHSFHDAAVYTTAKNLVAAVLLVGVVGLLRMGRPAHVASSDPGASLTGSRRWTHWLGVAYVGVVGGGVAFVLFFDGLARTTPEPAAFLRDTMVVWVALLAFPCLGERLSPWNLAAIVLLVGGQVAVTGGVGHLVVGQGEVLVLGATVLWAVETVVAKRLLGSTRPVTLGVTRMGIGVVVLVASLAVTGRFGVLAGLDARQFGWALLTGGLLAAYVGTWMVALSRGRAVDVTSVLAASVVVTSLLQLAAGHAGSVPEAIGLVLVVLGTVAVARAWRRPALAR
jgi:drug/metabolite transporter (DMT)-like permease